MSRAVGLMRSRPRRKPCVYCKDETNFERLAHVTRGGNERWEVCCDECGSRPARRAELSKAA